MKRFFRIFAVAALACATIVACDNKFDDYDPAEKVEGAQAYFSNESATTYTISKVDVAPIAVTVMRGETESALSLPITLSQGEEGAFSAPQKAEFKAGQNKTTINLTYDPEKLEDGASYKVTLTIGDQSATTPYGNNVMTLTIKVPEPYVLLGKALIREDIIATIFDIDNIEWEVEVYENLNTPGYIYLKNAYTSEFPYNEPGDYVEGDTYFAINISDPTKVVIPKQGLGCDWNPTSYGEFIVGTAAYGKLEDNIITFPTNGLLIGMQIYTEGGFGWYANANGLFRVALPGAVLTDYSLGLAYGGFQVDSDDETTYTVTRVAFGADVAQIQYGYVEGDITQDAEAIAAAITGIADGSIASTVVDAVADNDETDAMNLVSPEAMPTGIYTIVALPVSAEGEVISKDAAILSFYNPGVGESAVPDVDLKAYAMTLEELETYDESLTGMAAYYASAGYNATNCYGFLFEGSEIAELKVLPATTASIGDILANGFTLEEYVLAYDAQAQDIDLDISYVNKYGWDYTIFGAKAGTSYTCLVYVKNAYGKTALYTASHTTDAADATAKRKVVLQKLDGVTLNKSYKNVEIR